MPVEELILAVTKGSWQMRLSHLDPVRVAQFDDPNVASAAGLVPLMGSVERAGLADLADDHLSVAGGADCAAGAKVSALVVGMVAGADSIADMDVLRHGGMGRLFTGVRAPKSPRSRSPRFAPSPRPNTSQHGLSCAGSVTPTPSTFT